MKRTYLILSTILILSYVGCNNQEEKTEEVSIETAVEEMTEALDTTNVVEPVVESEAAGE